MPRLITNRRWIRAGLLTLALGLAVGGASLGAVPAAASAAQPGGVTLDGWGGLHPFGGMTLNTTGAPYWSGWDIARSVAIRADGSGGWVLDGWGGIHSFGTAGPTTSAAYWPGWDIARAIVPTSHGIDGELDGVQGYVLDGWGGLHPWGGAPALTGIPFTAGQDTMRGLSIHVDLGGTPDGGWTMDINGTIRNFGAAPTLTMPGLTVGSAWQQLHVSSAGSGYAVGDFGVVRPIAASASPDWTGYTDYGTWDITRDIALGALTLGPATTQPASASAMSGFMSELTNTHGGVSLDGYGGVHAFGGFPLNHTGAPYWPGWDIARAVAVLPDGSGGWLLDGWGAVHNFGNANPVTGFAYWPGWDISRALVPTSYGASGLLDGAQGYTLDGWGGVHPWGGAPALAGWPYFPGQDIMRGLEIHYGPGGVPDGGWTADVHGRVYAFGAAGNTVSAPLYTRTVTQGFHGLDAGGYLVDRFGVVIPVGSIGSPYWDGYSDWGGWDIERDVVLVNPTRTPPVAQPVSGDAVAAHTEAVFGITGVLSRPECGRPNAPLEGGKMIVISLSCQELTAYQNGTAILTTLVTTGEPALATPPGLTQVMSKNHPFLMVSPWPRGSRFWYVPSWVQYVMWFRSGGYGIHDASWRPTYGPGTEANGSHGCVNVPLAAEISLFYWADIGTPVEVY